jgi:hypothetical protein
MKANGERRGDGRPWDNDSEARPLKLSDIGITKTQSSKWQRLFLLPPEKFKIRVEHAKARVIEGIVKAGRMLREMAERGERDSAGGDRVSEKAKSRGAIMLKDLGFTRNRASRWQLAAMLPDKERAALREATGAHLIELWERLR